jgi:hypothetical protein
MSLASVYVCRLYANIIRQAKESPHMAGLSYGRSSKNDENTPVAAPFPKFSSTQ